jgi:hypothetical protein
MFFLVVNIFEVQFKIRIIGIQLPGIDAVKVFVVRDQPDLPPGIKEQVGNILEQV